MSVMVGSMTDCWVVCGDRSLHRGGTEFVTRKCQRGRYALQFHIKNFAPEGISPLVPAEEEDEEKEV